MPQADTHRELGRSIQRNLELAAAKSAEPRGLSSLYQHGMAASSSAPWGLWNARRAQIDGVSKNAEAYVPLPQATRRRVCIGLYVIHFLLCGFPALGRAFLNSENLSEGDRAARQSAPYTSTERQSSAA